MSPQLPKAAQRLFAHYDDPQELAETAPSLVMARLMEEGDSRDLRWMTSVFPEARLRAWFDEQGHRQLSRRSRAFWHLVLGRSARQPSSTANDLWPL